MVQRVALYEWALSNDPGLRSPKYWAKHFVTHMARIWPKAQLGDPEVPGETIGFSVAAIYQFLGEWKKKYHRDLHRPREMACTLILKTQMYAPTAAVRIMDYFKPAQNVLVNQGALMPQPKAAPPAVVHVISHGTQTTERGRTWADVANATPQPRPPVGRTPIDEASPPSASPDTPATLPAGVLRSGEGSGRGGGLQPGFKLAMCELISDCGVPIRDVPKVFAVVWTAIFKRPPPDGALFGHSHISEWMTDLGAAGLQADIAAFWRCREKWGDVKLHVHHDGTGRADRVLGNHAHLMAFVASYFDPDLNRAVWFVLSMRFCVGGSADQTAHGMMVSLADLGLLRALGGAEAGSAVRVVMEEKGKGVILTLGSDNTASAVNVVDSYNLPTKEAALFWPCPTHVLALFGKTPIEKWIGDPGTDFSALHAMNITNKWWWIWGKQIVHLKHYCLKHPEATELVKTKPIRGLQGKWESVSDSMEQLYAKVDLLRAMSVAMEHKNIGMKETWRTDWKLLKQMLHSGKIWFEFLVIYDWHELFVQPAFYMLKSKSIIKPKSGADFRREHIPKLALEALVLAQDLPQPGASDAVILAKAAKYLPKALKHAQQRPSEGAARKGFEIYSQDMTAWLRAWAEKFCPQAMQVVTDHWMGFLTAPFLFGLATDPEIGAYFTRALLAAVAPATAPPPAAALLAGMTPKAVAECKCIDRLLTSASEKLRIKLCFSKLGLADSAEKRASWLKLCGVDGSRAELQWTRADLPGLAPFFEAYFFGGSTGNRLLEALFSVYGHHIQDQMGATLKEAAVRQNLALRAEKAARRDAALRQRPLPPAELAARGGDAELPRADDSIPQLQLRGLQLAARMEGASKENTAAARAFRLKREKAWELYVLREAKAYDVEALAKRQAGRAELSQNAFAQERAREKEEAKKAREREPASPTGDTPPAKKGAGQPGPAKSKRPGPLLP